MAAGEWVVVVDPGSREVRAVALRRGRGGRIEVAGYGVAPSQGIARGVVVDPFAASDAMRRALQAVAHQSGVEVRSIRCAVANGSGPARFPSGETASGSIPALPPRPSGPTIDAGAAARWMAERRASGGTVRPDPALHRAAAGAGVLVEGWHAAAVAAGHAVLTGPESARRILVIDLGAGSSMWGLWNAGSLEATGTVPIGGDRFTADLSIVLECDSETAEQLKCADGGVRVGSDSGKGILYRRGDGAEGRISSGELAEILEARALEWLDWMQRSVGDWSGLDTVVLTGGGSRLRGMTELILDRTGLSVRRGAPVADAWRGTPLEEPEASVLAGIAAFAFAGNAARANAPGWETSVRWLLESWREWWRR
ncbi:MAG: cell division FtsA domain-containing protein [Armatimonadota bacterium]